MYMQTYYQWYCLYYQARPIKIKGTLTRTEALTSYMTQTLSRFRKCMQGETIR